jgi:hypothetical protein
MSNKINELLKEIEMVNERYIEDFNYHTNEIEKWLPSVSSTIISVAQKVVKILSFLLWLSPPYDNIIRLEYFSEGKYIMVRVDQEGIMILIYNKFLEEIFSAEFTHEELVDVG